MTAQYLVRASDPISSVLAAEGACAFSGGHCERILRALKKGAATPHELQARTGLTVVQLDRRLPELARAGRARVVQVDGADLMRGKSRVWEVVT